jgi:hypothetical protein
MAVVNKLLSHMTAMAIKDEEPVVSPAASFLLRTAVENLFKLR